MDVCRNCGARLVVKSTKKTAEQLKKTYYYSAYYWCTNCKKLYHDEKFKVINQQQSLPSSLFGNTQTVVDVEIWTDGACIHNGTLRARAAWGFVSGKTERAGLVDGLQTNNRAEAYAIYHALVWAAEKGYRRIKLHTDSQISIHGVSKDPSKVLKNRDIFEQIAQVIKGTHLQVEFVKVLGHSGDVNNERVDKLANDLARSEN
ncbi:MAG TPA: RNase H family protein [Patescibacteria group bacterium]|nr:RNase H family protein [Patescibacteria group bacterium]